MAKKPLISTVVLNWNRANLLEQTLTSYIDTVTCANELWIIDNNSSDHSRDVVERFQRAYPETKVLWLKENMGGEAFNEVIPQLTGELVYLVENDQIHLPGWCEKALQVFQTFPWLGQFSLHSPVPTDAEAWVTKPVKPRFKKGCLVYQLYTNVTTSCIIRRSLFEKGLTVRNIPNENSKIKLPDDGSLGGDVKNMGYWIAYSDQYYVRNVGHEAEEIEKHPDYYLPNYQAKTMVGTDELSRRIGLQKRLSKIQRRSVIFPEEPVQGELSNQAVRNLEPRFWSMFDSRTPEVEAVDFIHSLVRMTKPENILETSGWRGIATVALSQALSANGFGKLTSLEADVHAYEYLSGRINALKLPNVIVRNDMSERFVSQEKYDFVLFNSEYEDQEEEFFHIAPFLKPGATLVFANARSDVPLPDNHPATYERFGMLYGQHFATPRGLYVGKYYPVTEPEKRRIIFGLSSGRSGTAYLTSLLKGLPGLIALHEPEPKYQWQTLGLQHKPATAADFIKQVKQPAIQKLPPAAYFEASHYLAKGFMEAWLDAGITPDAIVMERDLRKVALSWFHLNVDFFANPSYVLQHMLHPEDKRQVFLPLQDWRSLNNYQLCYWYALESRKRSQYYAELLASRGANVFYTSLEGLISGKDLMPLVKWLELEIDDATAAILKIRSQHRVNDKNQFKARPRIREGRDLDLDSLEAEVLARCGLNK